MVKRRKEEDFAGVLEFEGLTNGDPKFKEWLDDHKARNGGKIQVSQGGRGIRVMFSKEADMALWRSQFEQAAKGRKVPA